MSENNKKYLTEQQRTGLRVLLNRYNGDYMMIRRGIHQLGITGETYVLPADFELVQRVLALSYKDTDKGAYGDQAEVSRRCNRHAELNRPLKWAAFFARRAGQVDNIYHGIKMEDKSGAGDWLKSHTAQTREEAIAEYRTRKDWIRWIVEDYDICFICPWPVLFDVLDTYNEKGCAQFFKSNVYPTDSGIVVQLQEFRTSKKKLAWLAAHSINMLAQE